MIFFGEQLNFEVFGPKWTQNEVFQVLPKVKAWHLSAFLQKDTAAKRFIKLT